MLVEDNVGDALLVSRLVRAAAPDQYDITHHRSMKDACQYLAEHKTNIVLLDLGLPDATGLDTLKQMLAAAPHVPVLVMTGLGDETVAAKALRAGAQDFLVKGEFQPGVVLRALRYAVERKALEEQVYFEREGARTTLNSIGDAVICLDEAGGITFLNRAAEIMTGLAWGGTNEALSSAIRLTSPSGAPIDLRQHFDFPASKNDGNISICATITSHSGTELPVEYIVHNMLDRTNTAVGMVCVLRDLSATRALSAKLEHMAQHDALTGLPNRPLLLDRIRHAIAMAERHANQPGVLFLDLDDFKHVNDSLGHAMGDKLLQSVADRLAGCVRTSDTVSRVGGDEFVILLAEITNPEDAAIAANRMLNALKAPHKINQHELYITTSIGISLYPGDGNDAEKLIKNADTAMYWAKENGRNGCRFFEPAMNLRAAERQFVEDGLRYAIERNELSLHFQPKFDLASGKTTGAEALLRWTHPVRGSTPPVQFISVAEDSGLIIPIGKWVMREACRQAKAWVDIGSPMQCIAVNVSAPELEHEHFLDGVFNALEETGLEPHRLELEVTERVLMKCTSGAAESLRALHDWGVRIAIDNFGTGYSSLSCLTRFPVNALKIDQSFVRQITDAPPGTAIVKAVLSMARSLNLRVVAEGVETLREMAFLKANLCDEGQGYYFSRPLPAAQFEAFLRASD
jgi:diguanylate cyclase (GGDEF)-like protein/PAS domain S-box-containing protein